MFSRGTEWLLSQMVVKYGVPTADPSIVPLYGVPVSVTPPAPTPGVSFFSSAEGVIALAGAILLAILGGYVLIKILLSSRK